MDYQIDKNGKKIAVSYFGDLQEKINFAKSYTEMFNSMAAENNQPQIDVNVALKKITKAHNKFYNLDNKYDARGNLKNA